MSKLGLAAVCAALQLVMSGNAALAQAPGGLPPPVDQSVDERGVDVVSGAFRYVDRSLSIGEPDAGGLTFIRTYNGSNWRDTLSGTIFQTGTKVIVSIGPLSEEFTATGSGFIPKEDTGSTLTIKPDDSYEYITSDGTINFFVKGYLQPLGQPDAIARLTHSRKPNGDGYGLVYRGLNVRVSPSQPETITFYRVQSVQSSRGYQIHLTFNYPDPIYQAELDAAFTVSSATAFNNTVDACNGSNNTCPYTRTWPSVAYTTPFGSSNTNIATDNTGRSTTITTGPHGVTGIKLPGSSSNNTSISYYTDGRVSSLVDASGSWTYSYATSGTSGTTYIFGPLSRNYTYYYNLATKRVTQTVDSLGRSSTFTYDSQGRTTSITYPELNSIHYSYGPRGNITTVTQKAKPGSGLEDIVESAAFPSSCSYAPSCNKPTSTTNARGGVTNYVWSDTHGGLERITLPSPGGSAARPELRLGYATHSAYVKDVGGSIVARGPIVVPVSQSQCITGSAPACLGTSNEIVSTSAYETSGALTNLLPKSATMRSGNGTLTATTQQSHDANGDVLEIDGPLPGSADTQTFFYDTARRFLGIVDPDPDGAGPLAYRARRLSYNAGGQAYLVEAGTTAGRSAANWAAFSPLQRVVRTYDAAGRPTTVQSQNAAGVALGLVQQSYDASGRPECSAVRMNPNAYMSLPASACSLGVQGPHGPDRVTKTLYDAASQTVQTISGFGSSSPLTESISYSLNGHPTYLTDANSNISRVEYDGFDRVRRSYYPNATGGGSSTSDYVQYGYDKASNVITIRSRAAQTFTTTYDALDRPTALTRPAGMDSISYSYDNLGRMLTATSGQTVTRTWDALSRLISENGPLGMMSYQYDLAGRRIRQTWPDAFYVTNSWNLAHQMTAILQGGSTQILGYGYDNLGRRTSITRGNGVSSTYTYDGVSRLASLNHNLTGSADDVTFTYGYNPAGQIATRVVSNSAYVQPSFASSTAYTNNGLNRVTTVGGAAVGYDANGNITNDTTRTFAYDAAGRAISANGGASTLSYDPLGRLYEVVGGHGGKYIYDGAETVGFAGSGTTINNRFVRGPGADEIVANFTSTGSAPAQYWASDERGSLINLTVGVGGATTVINTYDEYGVPSSSNLGRLQYTGQLWLPDFGAYHYKARIYQPMLGRFLQTDPLGYGQGANLYSYVEGDPINLTDPSGLQTAPGGSQCYVGDWCDQPVVTLDEIVAVARGNSCDSACANLRMIMARFSFNRVDTDFVRPFTLNDPRQCGRLCWMTAEQWAHKQIVDELKERNAWMVDIALAPTMLIEAPILLPRVAGYVGRAGRAISRLCECFAEGTPVHVEGGIKPIEQIKVGDLVLARDESTGATSYRAVTALISEPGRPIWTVEIESIGSDDKHHREIIRTTDEHPWRTTTEAWVETQNLERGAELVTADGRRAFVIEVGRTDQTAPTYNFEVDGFHTYFVGDAGLWVHNSCISVLNITSRGARVPNHLLSTSADSFASNLVRSGYTQRALGAGAREFTRPGSSLRYVIRPSNSAGTAADVYTNGVHTMKYSFGGT